MVGTKLRRSFLSRHPACPDHILLIMVKEHTLPTCYLAVWMIKGEMTQAQVARDLGDGLATIR